eukprot:CAMPEP_0194575424 /NCGR_PEP_ID=MMETSP0292-20121207/10913_1 /TAXON_ID=39354 /ORGANISM="Heterosigma akashiwo, Strain CCMP2393" /LENGTH=439 /DNA_ID=CAMNT_0039427207 /DNA_START=77 /DNA_END=1396 /DNA_ORIENTATION=-
MSLEEKKDFSKEVGEKLPAATKLAEAGQLEPALELLTSVEKKCRLGNDVANLKEVILTMVRLCRKAENWEQLNSTLTVLSKRRSQNTKAITGMVRTSMEWVPETPSKDAKVALVITLRDITDGKIFLEAERAQLTRILADVYEADGDVQAACDCMGEVHVETYGAVGKKEKAEFILEQLRLTLAREDYVRAVINSRKLNRKILKEDGMQEIKVRFYELMIRYDQHENNPLAIAQHYHEIYDTPSVQADPEKADAALSACVLFLVLSPHSNEQADMLERVKRLGRPLERVPDFQEAARRFTTPELIRWPMGGPGAALAGHPALARAGADRARAWTADLRVRVVQHNIRTIAKYYKQIRMKRLSEHLQLTEDETETHLAALVSEHGFRAKMDRPGGVVAFAQARAPEGVLSDWNSDISQLLGLVERTCHLINKENMIHKIL